MRRTALVAVSLLLPLAAAADVSPAGPRLLVADRTAAVAPSRAGCTYVGGGNVDVKQPGPDTVLVSLTGAVVATGHPCGSTAALEFDVEQHFEIAGGPGRLSLEAEAVGVLRGGRIAAAAAGGAAAVTAGGTELVSAVLPDRSVGGGENLTVADRCAPEDVPIGPGSYVVHVRWRLSAAHPRGLRGKAASAEFAPEPALDPVWIGGPRDPFHGVNKKEFGLKVILRVAPAMATEPARTARRP